MISRFLSHSLLVAAALASACSSGPSAPADDTSYREELSAFRAARDEQFRKDKDPIPANKRDVLLPLRYYPPDPAYTVAALNGPPSRSMEISRTVRGAEKLVPSSGISQPAG